MQMHNLPVHSQRSCFWNMVERNDNKPTGEELIRLTARCKAAG
jgi:hypothetical protein